MQKPHLCAFEREQTPAIAIFYGQRVTSQLFLQNEQINEP